MLKMLGWNQLKKLSVFQLLVVIIGISFVAILAYYVSVYLPQRDRQELVKFYSKECEQKVNEQMKSFGELYVNVMCPTEEYPALKNGIINQDRKKCLDEAFSTYVSSLGYDYGDFRTDKWEDMLLAVCIDRKINVSKPLSK